ncbi:MAG: urease accessory protein UreD [Gloeobacteraceae cyanobacterium ES-bin-316]|nr:urease accessory protein UreD [Ferruginibacter sp.]
MKASVHIEVAAQGSGTFLKKAYFETPFKLANVTEDKEVNPLELMLMSCSPGILDEDDYVFKIDVGQNAALYLQTQAYQRIFHMKKSARQELKVNLNKGSSFCFLPHPTVPHEQSDFTSCNNFYLADNCRFIFGEVLTCGRKLNGEVFLFTKYQSISSVFLNNKLIIKENLLMMPSFINVAAMGQMEGYTHQAGFIYLQQTVNMEDIQQQVLNLLAAESDIEFGTSILPANGLIIRLLGKGAEQLYNCLLRINAILPQQTVNTLHHVS